MAAPGWHLQSLVATDCAEAQHACYQMGGEMTDCHYDNVAGVVWYDCLDDPYRHGEFDDPSQPPLYPPDPDFPDSPGPDAPDPIPHEDPPGVPAPPRPTTPTQHKPAGMSTGAKWAIGLGLAGVVGFAAYKLL